jgi:hypothetical protein
MYYRYGQNACSLHLILSLETSSQYNNYSSIIYTSPKLRRGVLFELLEKELNTLRLAQ